MLIRLSTINDKMHRKLIAKGIPEAIANYVSDERNSFPKDKRKFVAAAILERYQEKGEGMPIEVFLGVIREDLLNIRDWLRSARAEDGRNLNMHLYRSFGDMLAAAAAWHEKLAESGEGHPALYRDIGPEWTERVFDNGWKIVRVSPRDAANEGDLMGHCAGSYARDIEKGESRLYSLRDPGEMPHVTIEIKPNFSIDEEIGGLKSQAVEEAEPLIMEEEWPEFAPKPSWHVVSEFDRPLFEEDELRSIPGAKVPAIPLSRAAMDEDQFIEEHVAVNMESGMPRWKAEQMASQRWDEWMTRVDERLKDFRDAYTPDKEVMDDLYSEHGFYVEQIKGQANTAPKEEYRGMLRDFVYGNLGWDGEHKDYSGYGDVDTYYLEDDDYFFEPLMHDPASYKFYGKYLSSEGQIELFDHYLGDDRLWRTIAEEQDVPELVLGRALQRIAEADPSQLVWTGPQDPDDEDEYETYNQELWDSDIGNCIEYIRFLQGRDDWYKTLEGLAKLSREKGRYGTLDNLAEVPGGERVLEQMIAEENDPQVLQSILYHAKDPETHNFLNARMAELGLIAGKKMLDPDASNPISLPEFEAKRLLEQATGTEGIDPEHLRGFYDLYGGEWVAPDWNEPYGFDVDMEGVLSRASEEGRAKLLSVMHPEVIDAVRRRVENQRGIAAPGMHELLGLQPPEAPVPQRLDASLARKMLRLSSIMDAEGLYAHSDSVERSMKI